jgi:hypothetical protein
MKSLQNFEEGTMKLSVTLLLSCLIATPMAYASTQDAVDNDAVLTETPLPEAGVNQRPVVGEKTVLLIATHWQDSKEIDMQKLYADTASEQPGSLGDYIRQASMGKLTLKWTTVTVRITTPYPGWSNSYKEAAEEALKQGYDHEKYDYLMVIENGPGGGQAWMPGRTLIVRGQYGGHYLWAHEFGHNLGFNHGNTYTKCPKDNETVFAPDQCVVVPAKPGSDTDTGDPVSQGRGLYPANNRWYAGWLDDSQVAVIERSGLYRLGVLGQSGTQLYLINRTGLTPRQIALEYRKPTHYDNFPPTDNRANGVWVRYTTMGSIVNNVQLDATPETTTTTDPTLQPIRTLVDDDAKIKVRVCSTDAASASIAVSVGGEILPACEAPHISSPLQDAVTGAFPIFSGRSSLPGATVTIISIGNPGDVLATTKVDVLGHWSVRSSKELRRGTRWIQAGESLQGLPDKWSEGRSFHVIDH